MADVSRTVEVIFAGRDMLSDVARSAGSGMGALNTAALAIVDTLAELAKKVLAAEAALVAVGTAFAVNATDKAFEFESAIIGLEKVLDDGEGNIDDIKNSIMDMALEFGVSSVKVANSMADFKEAGYSLSEAMDLTAKSMTLVKVSELDSATATEKIIALLKGFKAPASDAGRALDIMNEVSAKYATNVGELAIAMGDLSPIARTMGFSMEETAGLVTPVIEIFRSGSESANALKTGLLKLIDDSAPVQEALSSIGVTQKYANGQLRSGHDILFDVAKAFTTLDQNQKLFVTSQLVGLDQSARMVEVFDSLGKVQEITSVAMNSSGSAARELAKVLESGKTALERFKTEWENLNIVSGSVFKEQVKGVINAATELERALTFSVVKGDLDGLLNAMKPTLKAVEDLFKGVAKAIPDALKNVDFSQFGASVNRMAETVGGLLSGLLSGKDITDPDGLRDIIQTVFDAIGKLTDTSSAILKQMGPTFDAVGEAVRRFSTASDDLVGSIGKMLGQALVIEQFGYALGGAFVVMKEGGIGAQQAVDALQSGVRLAVAEIYNDFLLAKDGVLGLAAGILGAVDALPFIDKEVSESNKRLLASLKDAQSEVRKELTESATSLQVAREDWAKHGDTVARTIDGAKSVVTGWGETVTKVMEAVPGEAEKSINNVDKVFKSAGTGFQEFFGNGGKVASFASDVTEGLEGIAKPIPNLIERMNGLRDGFSVAGESAATMSDKTAEAALKVNKSAEATATATDATRKMAEATLDAKLKMEAQANAAAKLANEFAGVEVNASRTKMEWAKLDIEAAKLQVSAKQAGLTTFELGKEFLATGEKVTNTTTKFASVRQELLAFGGIAVQIADKMKGVSDQGLKAVTALGEVANGAGKVAVDFQEAATKSSSVLKSWAELDIKVAELSLKFKQAGVEFKGVGDQFLKVGQVAGKTGITMDDVRKNFEKFAESIVKLAKDLKEVDQPSLTAALAIAKAGNEAAQSQHKFAELGIEASKIKLGFAELQVKSNELDLNFRTEKLKASVEHVKTLFGSIDNTMSSTGNAVSSLFGKFAEVSKQDYFAGKELLKAVKEEMDIRKKAAGLQSDLIEKQIEAMQIKNNRLLKDKPMEIKLSATGLEPALDLIFREVLKKVQVMAAAEQAEFLLGIS